MEDAGSAERGTPGSLELTRAVADAFARADWAALRALYHDEALLSTLAAQQQIVSPDELMRIFARLMSDDVYDIGGTTTTAIDEAAVVVTGQIRYPLAPGGFGEGQRAWILTYRDGLVYRTCGYTSAAKARAAYAEHGVGLGIESESKDPEPPLSPEDVRATAPKRAGTVGC